MKVLFGGLKVTVGLKRTGALSLFAGLAEEISFWGITRVECTGNDRVKGKGQGKDGGKVWFCGHSGSKKEQRPLII